MKKLLFLTASFLLLCITGNAQSRKTWDFSQGLSDETKANLNADATNWASNRTDADGNTTGWKDATKMSGTLMANGVVIKELEGLKLGTAGLSNGNNILLDPASIRLSRKNSELYVPNLASGQKLTVVAKSANSTSARGITAVNTNMTKLEGPTDDVAPGSDGYQTWVYQVNEGFTDSVEIGFKILNGGVDIQSIVIDDGDAPAVEEDKKVAYIYNSTDYDENNDYVWAVLSGAQGMQITLIDIAGGASDVTLDSLQSGFDVIVVSPYVNANDAYVSTLKSAIAYEPMLNLNPYLYSAWGYGNALKSEVSEITVVAPNNTLFKDENVASLISNNTIPWLSDGTITGVTLSEYFANDDTLATVGAGVAIHKHNDGRNSYMLLPYAKDEVAAADEGALTTVLPAAILNLAKSKKEVTAVGAPTIKEEYADKATTVTLSCSNTKAEIYYTLDGSEPSSASTAYTEPFTLTDSLTVKAIAYADGYTESKVAELKVTIKQQAATPTFSVAQESGKSTVTISSATEGATIYYNYTGSDATAESQIYADPIEVTTPVTITAFATCDGYVNSNVASQYVDVQEAKLRYDILTSFNANREDWSNPYDSTGKAKATYLFSWGKKARSMYDTTQPGETTVVTGADGQPLKDANGNDSTVTKYPEMAAETLTGNNGEWIAESQGQVLDWENTAPKFNIGDNSNYNPVSAEDIINANDTIGITEFFLNFGAKVSGEPYNARLRTAQAYAGPFDIVIYAGQGNGSSIPEMNIEISKDGQTWDSLSQVRMPDTKRMWHRTKVSYENADPVYVRVSHVGGGTKGHIYNVYLLNAGTHTQEYITGIVDINSGNTVKSNISHIYSLNGVRQNSLQRGVNIVRYTNGTVRKVMGK